MTITGCLREAPAGATATSGSSASAPGATDAAGAKAGEGKYVLENAKESSASGSANGASKTYHLVANDSALTPHVGKKLELTGTLDQASASEPKLQVESGKVIADSCTP